MVSVPYFLQQYHAPTDLHTVKKKKGKKRKEKNRRQRLANLNNVVPGDYLSTTGRWLNIKNREMIMPKYPVQDARTEHHSDIMKLKIQGQILHHFKF